MQTRFAGMTDTGLLREHNEDSLLLLPEYGIVAVADGMGGHRSGDVASQLAVSTLSDFFSVVVGRDGTWPFPADPNLSDEENYVITGLRLANRRIFDRSLRTIADFGMGTTIVAAMFTRDGRQGDRRPRRRQPLLPPPRRRDPPAHARPLAHQRRPPHGALDDGARRCASSRPTSSPARSASARTWSSTSVTEETRSATCTSSAPTASPAW